MDACVYAFIITGTIVSIFFSCISFVLMYTYQSTIFHRPLFHWNLRSLMRNMAAAWMITKLLLLLILVSFLLDTRLLESHSLMYDEFNLYYTIQITAIGVALCAGFGFALVVLERCAATLRLKTYEKERHPRIYMDMAYLPHLIAIVGISLNGLMIAFIYNYRWNQKKYSMAKQHLLPVTLSERFQLSENIRVSRLMLRSMFVAVIGGFLVIDWFYVYRTLFYLFLMITSAFYLGALCISLPFWKEMHVDRLRDKFNQWRNYSANKVGDSLGHLQTLEGRTIAWTQPVETSIHFEHLQSSWNARAAQMKT
ncbi:hypothetical protein M3Y96_00764100 [Aphelenchoides besseyi]|nr:hypothetical protein M3Y96_00764100 [Aphelenchoides besseyi]